MLGVINGAGGGLTGGAGGVGIDGGTGVTTGGGITTGGGGGGVVQAATSNARTTPDETVTLRRIDVMGIDMWLLIAEAGVALFLLVFIVWWTMYAGKKPTDQKLSDQPAPRLEDTTDKQSDRP